MFGDGSSAVVPSSVDANIDPALLGASSYAPLTWITAYAGPNSGTLESNVTHASPLKFHISKILSNSWFTPHEIKLWGSALESSSSKYQYVQHSLLALSTLIDEFNHRIEWPEAHQQAAPVFAYQHHITASTLFRQSPPVVDEHNWVAVLAFGLSIIIFHFAVQQLHPDPEFNVLETFRILRTTMALNEASLPHLKSSKFWPLILSRTLLPNLSMDIKLRTALQNMGRVITRAVESSSKNADVHKQAFWELREWAIECQGNPRTWRHYLIWPAAVCEEYLDLVSSGDEISILIFIYWCAIMYQSPRRWFITSWSKRTALTAMRLLKADWGNVLYWPLEVFDMVPTVLPEGMPCGLHHPIFQSLLIPGS
jgi:hypothetical protein